MWDIPQLKMKLHVAIHLTTKKKMKKPQQQATASTTKHASFVQGHRSYQETGISGRMTTYMTIWIA